MNGMSVNSINMPTFEVHPRARTEATERGRFYVPASALRNDSTERTRPAAGSGVATARDAAAVRDTAAARDNTQSRDPAADAVELTRDFPGLVVPVAYPPPERTVTLPTAGRTGGWGTENSSANNGESGEAGASADTQRAEEDGAGAAEGTEESAGAGEATGPDGQPLADGEQQQLRELKDRDQEVRTHEQAHKAAGGQYAGAISYDYQQGPDGRRYAVGGEVSIDASPEKDPAATIAKMRQVCAAAMAPAEPSPQDRSVAAQAMQQENQARAEERAEAAEDGAEAGAAEATGGTGSSPEAGAEGASAESGTPGGAEAMGATDLAAAGRTQGEGEVEDAAAAALEGAVRPGASVRALPPARLSMAGGYGYGMGAFAGVGGGYLRGGIDVVA